MNIACLSMHSSPLGIPGTRDTGGMSTYLRELSAAMGAAGHRVDLYTAAGCGPRVRIDAFAPGVRVITLPVGSDGLHKLALARFAGEFAREVERFRKEGRQQYDILFSHYWLSGKAGVILQAKWGIPHLMMFHTLGAVKNALCPAEQEPERRIAEEKALAERCQAVVVAAQREKEALVRYYGIEPKKISVIPCGVNTERFTIQPPEELIPAGGLFDEKVIFCVGRLEPVKGLELLIRAAAALHRQGAGYRVIVAGGDDHSIHPVAQYRLLADQCGISEDVAFVGSINHERLPGWFHRAAVTVIPSYYESFGMVALESLACGTPVVATDVGDLAHIIRQGITGYVLEGRSPPEMAAAIADVLNWRGERTEVCRESILQFAWPEISRQMIDLFSKMSGEKESTDG